MRTKSAERIKADKYIAKHPNASASELRLKCGVSLVTAYKVIEDASRSSSLSDMVRYVSRGKNKLRMSDNPAVITGLSGKQYEPIDFTPKPFSVEEMLQETKEDLVNHPPHYTSGGIEVIDFIEAKKFNYHLGNAIKYVSRASHKGNYIQDLEKAKWYLEREIEKAKNES
jgi:hypothetical protein